MDPQLDNPGNQVNSAGDQVSTLSGNAPDGDDLTYYASNLPAGLTLDPVSGDISGTIANSAASSTPYQVTIFTTTGDANASVSFSWTVNDVVVTSPGDQKNADGDVVSLQVSATATGTLSYSDSGLPAGLSINLSTGLISGTISSSADASSPYSVTITGTDGPNSANASLTWTVAHMSVNSVGNQSSFEGQQVYQQVTGQDDDSGTLSYTATGLPAGLSISSSGLISGTLTAGSAASSPYKITVTETDSTYTATASFTWNVISPVSMQVSPQTNADGDDVSFAVNGSNKLGTLLSYSASGLPAGLSIDSNTGLIYGTIDGTGNYEVTITATDGTYSGSATFPWTVTPLFVTVPVAQNSVVGDTVSLALTVDDHTGSGPLKYGAVGLPAGLSINPRPASFPVSSHRGPTAPVPIT